jgi:hypothetical protein
MRQHVAIQLVSATPPLLSNTSGEDSHATEEHTWVHVSGMKMTCSLTGLPGFCSLALLIVWHQSMTDDQCSAMQLRLATLTAQFPGAPINNRPRCVQQIVSNMIFARRSPTQTQCCQRFLAEYSDCTACMHSCHSL